MKIYITGEFYFQNNWVKSCKHSTIFLELSKKEQVSNAFFNG